MPIERSYRVLAYPIRILAPARLSAFLHRLLAPFEAEVGADASRYELRLDDHPDKPWLMELDGRPMHRGRTPARILEFSLWDVSTKAIGSAHGCFAVHAAAASWRGRGIVLPAPPESGKSTLVAALTRAGFGYLTDEAALIDPATALLQPFPRSLWLSRASLDAVFGEEASRFRSTTGRQYHVRPRDLRPRAVARACPVGFVIAPRYEPGSTTALEPIARSEAVMVLARNAFHLERFGGEGIRLLGRAVERARCFRIRIGDLGDAVRIVRDAVERDAPHREPATARGRRGRG